MNLYLRYFLFGFIILGCFATKIEAQDRTATIIDLDAQSKINTSHSLTTDYIEALGLEEGDVVSLSFGDSDPYGFAIFNESTSDFPSEGNEYLVLSTGGISYALDENNSTNTTGILSGLNSPGGNDMVQMVIELNVPANANAIQFKWKFFSEEFPEFVGTAYNDAFLVEYGVSNFTINGNQVIAPKNRAIDCAGELITINTTGESNCTNTGEPTMSTDFASGTTYDGATETLLTTIPLIPGEPTVKLFFSVFDVGDNRYDTAVFLDEFGFNTFEPEQELELIALEVNQSIQDWNNSIFLVEGKPTIVRVHIQSKTSLEANPKNIRLNVTNSGEGLFVSLPADNFSSHQIPAHVNIDNYEFISQRRRSFNGSLNFTLPYEFLENQISLQLVSIAGDEINCSNTVFVSNECKTIVEFESVATPRIKPIEITWYDINGIATENEYDKNLIFNYLESAFPIDNVDLLPIETLSIQSLTTNPPNAQKIINKLYEKWLYDLENGNITDDVVFLGFINGAKKEILGSEQTGGRAQSIPGNVAFTNTLYNGEETNAHEFGHLLGLHHAVNSQKNGTVKDWLPWLEGEILYKEYALGFCNEVALLDEAIEFPYEDSSTPFGTISSLSNYGSLGNDIYGVHIDSALVLTSNYVDYSVSTSNDTTFNFRNYLPFPNSELMSYCNMSKWISDVSYSFLKESINSRFDLSQKKFKIKSQRQYYLVTGDFNIAEFTVSLSSINKITLNGSNTIKVADDGDFRFEFIDQDSNIVYSSNVDIYNNNEFNGEVIPFSLLFDFDSDFELVNVKYDSQLIGRLTKSPFSPVVSEIRISNYVLNDNEIIKWTTLDSDNDNIEHSIQYSIDEGNNWVTLATGWKDSSYSINPRFIPQTENGLIKIIATDGFNITESISEEFFTTNNKNPEIFINTPIASKTFVGQVKINFSADAIDIEDFIIGDDNIRWYSTIDGLIGNGSVFSLSALELSEGEHQITLQATDSHGATSTSEPVTITVFHSPPATTIPVSEIPSKTSLIEPIDGTKEIALNTEVLWNATQNAESYEFQLATDPEFKNLYFLGNGISTTHYPIADLDQGTIYYWRVRGENGTEKGEWSETWSFKTILYTNIEEDGIPLKTELMQNYPNPFNPSTELSYSLSKAGYVQIKVYNILGQLVAEIVNEIQSAGYYSVNFDASNLSSGVYIYQLKAGNRVDTKRMLLIK
jgi:hypothetical protein